MAKHRLNMTIDGYGGDIRQFANPDGVIVFRLSEDGSSLWPIDLNPARVVVNPFYVTWEDVSRD